MDLRGHTNRMPEAAIDAMVAVPLLVVVFGPPASGKTTLAKALGQQLELPVLSKDLVKEPLMDHLGGGPSVGTAAFAVQFAIARELLSSGVDHIFEGAFFRDQSDLADLVSRGNTLMVGVTCELELLFRRYADRQPSRHPGHRGLEAMSDLRSRVANGEYMVPTFDRPALWVDTTAGLSPSETEIVEWIRQHATSRGGSGYKRRD